jgi:hypothetical protein
MPQFEVLSHTPQSFQPSVKIALDNLKFPFSDEESLLIIAKLCANDKGKDA